MAKDNYKLGQKNPQVRINQRGPGAKMVEKPKHFFGTWKKILIYSKKYWSIIITAIIFAIISTIFLIIGPNKISDMTNMIADGVKAFNIDLNGIMKIGFLLIFMYFFSWVLGVTQGFMMTFVTQKVTKKMRTDISKKINKLPMSFFNRVEIGDVLSRVTNDVDTIGQSLNQSVRMFISAFVLLIGSLLIMLFTNWILALTTIATTLFGFFLISLIMSRSQGFFRSQSKNLGEINGHIEEAYAGHAAIKAYNAETYSKEKFNKLNQDLKTSAFKAQSLSGLMMPIMMFIGNFSYATVCIVGTILKINGYIEIGVIVAFMIYARMITQPLSQIAQSTQNMQSAAASAERVFSFLEAEEMQDESGKTQVIKNVRGDVEFINVRFGYDENKIIINDFSAKIKHGQKVAIVGPTGAGKTTIVNLLMRFFEINSGDIKIDGISTSEVFRENVHSQFCMVLQETWLFEGTIKENLVYSTKNIDTDKVISACKAVGLDHFIKTLPNGYDTVVDDKLNLSEGQKQQLTIARAMISDKPMLILDEATSSVDTRTELQIQSAMDKLMKNRTSFIIAHRLSTIKNADLILVLKDGDIIESGNHIDLLEKNGFYAELYNSQFTVNAD